jgi:hypothetical protein
MSLVPVLNLRRLCIGLDPWHYDRIVFVPREFAQWQGGGFIFDENYSDTRPDGKPVSVCTQYLDFLLSRRDKPEWLSGYKLEFIDLRHDANTLYFFMTRSAERPQSMQPFKLAGQELDPDLFDMVRSNFDLADVSVVRQTAASAASFPFDERVCDTLRIEFNLHDGSTLEELGDFEARTIAFVQNMMRECARAKHQIKHVVVDVGRGGDDEFFFQYALNLPIVQELLAQAQELEFVRLQLSRDLIAALDELLGAFPRLHVRVGKLFLYSRADQFTFPDRVHISHVKCSSQTRLDDVRALTTNPIGSIECPDVSDSDEH